MKIGACVILYNPEKFVEEIVKSYADYFEKIYVIDNTETTHYPRKSINSKISLIKDGINEGMSKRLNQACSLALKDKFDYLLTMDQDSCFEEKDTFKYLKCVEDFENKNNVALFGVNYLKPKELNNCSFKKTNLLITSGSIINLNAYKKIGPFDENLFIDLVDTDYCLRSIQKGFEIIEFSNVHIQHNLGVQSVHRSLKNLKLSNRSIHSSLRLYYMTRNYFYLKDKYHNDFEHELNSFKKDLIIRIKNNLLYQKGRFRTMALIIKGWRDYKKHKMGKISV